MTGEHTIILSLGSNTDAEKNMSRARVLMQSVLPDVVFTEDMSTEPVGIEGPWFLNSLCKAHTTATPDEVVRMAKNIEAQLGDTAEQRDRGRVVMDVDLLLYDDLRLHDADWQRPYVRLLINRLPCEGKEEVMMGSYDGELG